MIINGVEQPCLIIPTKENQIKRGKQGNWMMMCRLAECEPNARMQTHDIQLTYLTEEELQKSYDFGYHKKTAHLGRVYEHDRTPERKIDRTNKSADIKCDGYIVLSDIPKDLIFRSNAENAKRYISNLVFKPKHDNGFIYTGSICVDDIPQHEIKTDMNTGKKYISVRFLKLELLDTYMNTHRLIIARNDGSEIEIGRFKEWSTINGIAFAPKKQPAPSEEETIIVDKKTNIPDSIDGLKF